MLNSLISHYSGGNKSRFASLLGIRPQTVNTWFSRETFDAELIYAKCEGVSGDWLLSGEGEMLKADRDAKDRDGQVVALCRTLLRLQDEKDNIIGQLASLLK